MSSCILPLFTIGIRCVFSLCSQQRDTELQTKRTCNATPIHAQMQQRSDCDCVRTRYERTNKTNNKIHKMHSNIVTESVKEREQADRVCERATPHDGRERAQPNECRSAARTITERSISSCGCCCCCCWIYRVFGARTRSEIICARPNLKHRDRENIQNFNQNRVG